VILLDTCAIIFAALTPEKMTKKAAKEVARGIESKMLACSDISLWEMAMLISRGRLKPAADSCTFISQVVTAFSLTVLPITPEIAVISTDERLFSHKDPCDRIIAATCLQHKISLITSDTNLHTVAGLKTIWT
jgi:PIN domain nuclease of toxin-antitoxin system